MLIYYIRHGQSLNNLLFDNTGASLGRSEDPDLSPTGIAQLSYLANFIKSEIDHRENFEKIRLYTSPMIRAAKTAYAIQKSTGLSMSFHSDIFETGGIYLEENGANYGKPGINDDFISATFPDVIIPPFVTAKGWYNRPHETQLEARSRADRLVKELKTHVGRYDIVLIVAHGSFFQEFLSAISNSKMDEKTWFNMNNCGVTCISLDGDENVEIRYLNRFDFLPSSLIT
ncbi:MAG: histidine phosphatase family protein [Anaerolineaceae bacterium]|nr:histidine phosphatase family protein [Anaerolineaceae bacterium]